MPTPGRIRITKNSNLTVPLIDYRGAATNFIAWDGQFQITEFANEDYIEYDYEENEWYFNLYATIPGTMLSNLLDVDLNNLVDLDVLVYNILTGKWENSDRLTTAIQNISSIENEIAIINQTNIDQQTTIDTINTEITVINNQIGGDVGGSIPEGGIIMWYGYVIPKDWALCDGNNGTPDLTDRFIIGSYLSPTQDNNGAFGPGGNLSPTSSTSITVGVNNLPKHTHGLTNLSTSSAGDHTHTVESYDGRTENNDGAGDRTDVARAGGSRTTSTAGAHTHTISGTIDDGGFANQPITMDPKKYFKLAYIMRKAGTPSRTYPS
jgi:hypothetical protein